MLPTFLRYWTAWCLIVVLVAVEPIKSQLDVAHKRLYQALLKDYEKDIPPITTLGDPVNVDINFEVRKITEVNEKEEVLVLLASISMRWTDARLNWNQSEFGNVSDTRIPHKKIWTPDIVLYNSADPMQSLFKQLDSNAVIDNNGRLLLYEIPVTRTFCQINLFRFPYDTQKCQLAMGSWSYSDKVLNLTSSIGYAANSTEWGVLSFTGKVRVEKYACCPEGFPAFRVNITLQRKPGFYGYMFVSPAVLFSLLTPIIFLIPPSSGERTTLGSVLLLCLLGMLKMLDSHIPPQQVAAPLIGLYYTCTMVFVSIALGLSAFIANTKSRGNRQNAVPMILRKIFLGPIRSLVFVGTENFRPFNNMTPSGERSLTTGGATEPTFQKGETPTALERQLGDLVRQLTALNSVREREQIISEIVSDWQDLVSVLDRIFFVLFLLINIVATMAFLT